MKCDVIVVGGGIGGLTAGALLAKRGFKVHLIEQHDKVGGFVTSFKRRKVELEVAVHMIDGPNEYSFATMAFKELDLYSRVKYVKLPEFYKFIQGEYSINVPCNFEEIKSVLSKEFPNESNGIKQFYDSILEIIKLSYELMLDKDRLDFNNPLFTIFNSRLAHFGQFTVGVFLDSIVFDPMLKQIMLGNLSFYHQHPYELNFLDYACGQGSYLAGGNYYIDGGSQKISDALADIITENGGEITLNHNVKDILIENSIATKVLYHKKFGTKQEIKEANARYIIVNASIPETYRHLFKNYNYKTTLEEIDSFDISCSATTLYYGLNQSIQQFGELSFFNILSLQQNSQFPPSMFGGKSGVALVDYNSVGELRYPHNKLPLDLVFLDEYSSWDSLNEKDYRFKKNEIRDYFTGKIDQIFPGFKGSVEFCEVGTPKTVERYTKNPKGSIYGFSASLQNVFKRYSSALLSRGRFIDPKLDNVVFSSAWSYSAGVSGVVSGAYFAANDICKKESVQAPEIY